MNKTFFSFLSCLILTAATATAQNAQISLQHAGGVRLFDPAQMPQAIEAAVDGDTLYLNEGVFSGYFTINKAITVVGAGQTSIIGGDVTVSIPGTKTLTARVLDALRITGNVKTTLAVNGFNMRKCSFDEISFSADVDDVVIERCYCRGFFSLSEKVRNILVTNSKVRSLYGRGINVNAANLINCNIKEIYTGDNEFQGTITNSIIQGVYNSYYVGPLAIFKNCLLYNHSALTGKSTKQDCILGDARLDTSCESSYDTDTMLSKGWLGNDGTVMGIYGGTYPYTLEPAVPKVESYSIKVDTEAKVLSVSLKVKAN